MKISLIHSKAVNNPGLSRIIVGETENLSDIINHPWSPIITKEPYLIEENYKECTYLVLDIDNSPDQKQLRLDESLALFAPFKHVIATTKNHQVEKVTKGGKVKPATDRYRVILFFDKPVTDLSHYKNLWNFYVEYLGLREIVDPLKDGARFYYPSKEIISKKLEGLDLKTEVKLEDRLRRGPKVAMTKKELNQLGEGLKGAISKRTLSFLAQQASHEPWHHRFYTAALDLKTQGYTEDEAAEELAKASPEGALDETDFQQLRDVYMNDRGEVSEKRTPWPDVDYKETKEGDIFPVIRKGSSANCRFMLQNVMKLQLRLNSRLKLIEKAPGEFVNDFDISAAVIVANEHRLGLGKELIMDTINVIAKENTYDPLKANIEAVKWDGKSRFNELLNTLSFTEDVAVEDKLLYETFLRKWLIGVVTKIYNPGSENNMLVFVGAQGAGKTRWFRRLAQPFPQGFIEAHINTDDKDSHLNLLRYFIWSVSELDTVTWSKDVGALKDFITKSEVRVRPAYARYEETGSSITSFCASVNSRDFLHDTTGNRRYLILLVDSVNADHNVDIGQVFAEAKVLMERGERAWFSREEIEAVNVYNERFISRSDILESFEARVSAGDKCYSLKEIAEQLQLGELKNSDRRSIRDWMTKKRIKEVNHSNVKKYYVSIAAAAPTAAGSAELNKSRGEANRIALLRSPK